MTMRQFGSWAVRAGVTAGLASIALLTTASISLSEDPIDRFSLTGQVGITGLAMGQVNDQIDEGNGFLRQRGWTQLDNLGYGYNFAWNLRARVRGPLSVSLGGGQVIGETSLDFDEVISVEPSVRLYSLRLDYELPFRPMSTFIMRVGGGPVWYSSTELKVQHERRSVETGTERIESAKFEGDSWGAHGYLEGELVLSEKITLVADVGYRFGTIQVSDNWDWEITGLALPLADDDRDGIPNKWDFDEANSWLIHSFLEVQRDDEGRVILDDSGRPIVHIRRDDENLDLQLSGVVANVGLRFYLF